MAEYVNVAVDAMGGDNAPTEIVKGAVEAVNADKRVKVFLVGKEPVIREELKAYTYDAEQLEVVHAEEVIETAEPPVMAIRRTHQLPRADLHGDARRYRPVSAVQHQRLYAGGERHRKTALPLYVRQAKRRGVDCGGAGLPGGHQRGLPRDGEPAAVVCRQAAALQRDAVD